MLKRQPLSLSDEVKEKLSTISRSRTESVAHVRRAQILLAYSDGKRITDIALEMNATRPLVGRVIDKALAFGPLRALEDLSRSGRISQISDDAKSWLLSVACSKPKDLGYAHELWTYNGSSRISATGITKNIVHNPCAARRARPPANADGLKSPKTGTISDTQTMWNALRNGGIPTHDRAMGAGHQRRHIPRYKMSAMANNAKSLQNLPIFHPLLPPLPPLHHPHFSWVDHRLVRDKHIQRCDAKAWALYLFLVTVGNAHGVSWYADPNAMSAVPL